jgi:3-hydroxyisobutyrate dehydrogenase
MPDLRVGLIGVGAFGSRVALRLLWNGFHTLQLYDVNDISTRQFTNEYGGLTTGSPRMMAQTCNVVLTALPSAAELREACFGWECLTKGFAEGALVVDLGMTDPIETVAIAQELAARGISLVDAPAFGTPADAKEGKLVIVAGGEETAVERCRPVLETLGRKVLRAGAVGSAQAANAIVDYRRGAELLAASEAIRIGTRFGFDPNFILSMSRELGRTDLEEVLRRDVISRRFASGLSLGMMQRSLELAAKLAGSLSQRVPMLDATRALWNQAEAQLGSGADHTAVIRWIESLELPPDRTPQDTPSDEST